MLKLLTTLALLYDETRLHLLMTDKFSVSLTTARLLLRPLHCGDAETLFSIFSDPEVMRYFNTPPWASLEEAHDVIDSSLEKMKRQESITLAIVLKETNELIGKCMLFSYEPESKRAELGFGVARQHWGKGIIPEAGKALLEYGFDALGLRRIEAEIDPENIASAKTLERLGFIKEGLLRQRWEVNGVVSDSALYGLLVSD